MKKKIIIINGPNLNLLGLREPELYGHLTFEDFYTRMKVHFQDDVELEYFQSNHEGALIDKIQEIGFDGYGIVLNAGGYTHTSIALADCISAVPAPAIEVHITNIKEREKFRHHSYLEAVCKTSILGKGLDGYEEAIEELIKLL